MGMLSACVMVVTGIRNALSTSHVRFWPAAWRAARTSLKFDSFLVQSQTSSSALMLNVGKFVGS
jgi:hypothetical protein